MDRSKIERIGREAGIAAALAAAGEPEAVEAPQAEAEETPDEDLTCPKCGHVGPPGDFSAVGGGEDDVEADD